jgi:hypothetical protein
LRVLRVLPQPGVDAAVLGERLDEDRLDLEERRREFDHDAGVIDQRAVQCAGQFVERLEHAANGADRVNCLTDERAGATEVLRGREIPPDGQPRLAAQE